MFFVLLFIEFSMGEQGENTNDGPAPNMKTRQLIFDSIKTIIDKGSKDNSGKDDKLGNKIYVCSRFFFNPINK